MPIVQCRTCGKRYEAPEHVLGKQIRCQACNNVFLAADSSHSTGPAAAAPPPPRQPPPTSQDGLVAKRTSDEIDYEIFGEEMQYCEIVLDPGEQAIAEAGAMMFATAGIQMETVFGDPSQQKQGFWAKMATAGHRMMTRESLFMTTFTNHAQQRETVAFAAPYPGKILPLHLDELGGEIICQKDAFLCGARGVQIKVAFTKNIGVGIFGGEGFVLQRLSGDGIALVHAGGTLMYRELAQGETLKVDTGCLMAITPSVNYDIQLARGVKNAFFGGEGLFLATLTGPGGVWLQSLPFSRLAGRMLGNARQLGGSKGESSMLGVLGVMAMGD